MKRLISVAALLLLTGCGCKHPLIPVVDYKKANDWKMTCAQLENGMAEAEFYILSSERKADSFEYYAPNPLCMVDTYNTAIKSSEAAKDRMAYLNMIYTQKKCAKNQENASISEVTKEIDLVKLRTN